MHLQNASSSTVAPSTRSGALFIHREDLKNRQLIQRVLQHTVDVLDMNPHTVPDVEKEEQGILATLPSLGKVRSVINHYEAGDSFWKTLITTRGLVDITNTKQGMNILLHNHSDLEPYFQDQLSQVFPSALSQSANGKAHQPVKRFNLRA